MPTWLHILLAALIPTIILIGGSIFAMTKGRIDLAIIVPIPVAIIALFLYMRIVPSACPQCGARAYLRRSNEKRFYYECVKCGRIDSAECTVDE